MFDIRHGGQSGDGTQTRLVLEYAALHAHREDRPQSSSEHGGQVEGVREYAPERRGRSTGDEDDGDDADRDPGDGHHGDELGHHPDHRFRAVADAQADDLGYGDGEDDLVVVEMEHRIERHLGRALLDRDETYAVCQHHEDGDHQAELPALGAGPDVVR